jgi:PAS domain S-box-containing protein
MPQAPRPTALSDPAVLTPGRSGTFAGFGGDSDPFAAAVRATGTPMIITNPRLTDNPLVFVNDAFCELTGYDREEVIGRNCRFLQGPQSDPAAVESIRAAVRLGRAIAIDVRNHRKDGSAFWNRLQMAPVHDAGGELSYFTASQFDVTAELQRLEDLERHNADLATESVRRLQAQHDSEQRLRFATGAGRMGLWDLDLVSGELTASSVFRENFGRPASEPFDLPVLLDAVHPDDRRRVREAFTNPDVDGDFAIEFQIVRPDAGIGFIQMRADINRGVDGAPLRLVGVSMDVSERLKANEEKSLLLRELAHRIKNMFAVVDGVISLSARADLAARPFADALRTRLFGLGRAMAYVTPPEVMVGSEIAPQTLLALLHVLLEPYGDLDTAERRVTVSGDDVRIGRAATTSMALIINELATNALKYGALGHAGGTVSIELTKDGDDVAVAWREHVPQAKIAAEVGQGGGFGSILLENAIVRQLRGQWSREWTATGLHTNLRFSQMRLAR